MNRIITHCFLLLICCVWATTACAKDDKGSKIVHDAEFDVPGSDSVGDWGH